MDDQNDWMNRPVSEWIAYRKRRDEVFLQTVAIISIVGLAAVLYTKATQ